MSDWTDDIRRLMTDYEVKAPEGLLEEVKGRQQHSARIATLRRYRWITAAAVAAALVVPLAWHFSSLSDENDAGIIATTENDRPASRNGELAERDKPRPYNGSAARRGVIYHAPQAGSFGETNIISSEASLPSTDTSTNERSTDEMGKNEGLPPKTTFKKKTVKHTEEPWGEPEYYQRIKNSGNLTLMAYCGGTAGMTGFGGGYDDDIASDAPIEDGHHTGLISADRNNIVSRAASTRKAHHKQPIKVGVSIGYNINDRWSVQTGVTYSYLSSDFTAEGLETQTQKLHYVGIPLSASYKIVGGRKAELYATAGGEVEKLVKGKISTPYFDDKDVKESRPQWSVKAAVGGAYHFTPSLSVYVEPGVSYYFDNHSGVENAYKDKKTNFSLNIGLRFRIDNE